MRKFYDAQTTSGGYSANNNIPTAEEMEASGEYESYTSMMLEFARLHVTAALKTAEQLQASKYYAGETGYLTKKEWEEIYSLNLIK